MNDGDNTIIIIIAGDLGPIYGFQWRHFGAEYRDMHADYSGCGVDQLQQVIDTIRSRPNDRRIIICAWNPKGEASASPKPEHHNVGARI